MGLDFFSDTDTLGWVSHEPVPSPCVHTKSEANILPDYIHLIGGTSKHLCDCFEEYCNRRGSLVNNNVSFHQFMRHHGEITTTTSLSFVVEVPGTVVCRVHNITRSRIQLLAVILYLYTYYNDIIELRESTHGNNLFLLRVAVQPGLQGVNTDRSSRQSITRNSRESQNISTHD